MDTQDTQEFNQRLSQWVASQGFWFQLRHSLSGRGSASALMFHFLRMLATVGVFLLLVGLGFGVYLAKRVGSADFREQAQEQLRSAFSAEAVEIRGVQRSGGQALVRRVGMTGDDSSFFDSLEASNLSFKMGLTDGFFGGWDAGTVDVNWLDVELKAGANSPEDAVANAELLFGDHPDFSVQALRARAAHLSWGYFERAYGRIADSRMQMGKTGNSWRIRLEGGTFSQNWIRQFDIVEMVVVVSRDGLEFEKGVLRAGEEGQVTFRDVRLSGGVKPELSGALVFDRIPLERLLPPNAEELISGTISGEFALGGSTNSIQGVTMEGNVVLDGADQIALRNRLQLLEALDVVDAFRSYRRIEFDQGSFRLRTGGGRMEISELSLEADELMSIRGTIVAETPRESEIESLLGQSDTSLGAAIQESRQEELQLSLQQAARAARPEGEGQGLEGKVEDSDEQFFDSIGDSRELRREFMRRARGLYEFDGEVIVSVPANAFDRSSRLRTRYPVDPQTGRAPLKVTLKGSLEDLTADLAEELLRIGVRD